MAVLFFLSFIGSFLGLILGLLKPSIFNRVMKKEMTRKKLSLIFGIALITFFILTSITAPPASTIKSQIEAEAEQQTSSAKVEEKADIIEQETPQQTQTELYSVVSVTDGDTIKVNINGKTETLRLIGMDTPETVDPRKQVQCFGKEADNKAEELLNSKKVRLEADGTQGEKDKYNRLLRYVYLEDGTFYNKWMIAEGYAKEYTYNSNPYKYQLDFRAAEKQAMEQNKGLWNSSACNGDTTQPAESKITTNNVNTTEKSQYGACGTKKTCREMESCDEAMHYLTVCGLKKLDKDKDGVPCESICG